MFKMTDLVNKKCVPCEGGLPPFTQEQVATYKKEITSDWEVLDGKKLFLKKKFGNFKAAMVFVNKVADIAEADQHHPNIEIFYNIVKLTLWTHAIAGLSENDFILAAKIDQVSV